ncbi:MAG: tetratricopeptide repeat protein [Thermoguttaceae bacterium]|jgi:tetratricopeptide (TPR) repeat protein
MTLIRKSFLVLVAASLTFAATCVASLNAQEGDAPPAVPEAAQQETDDDGIEFDDSEPAPDANDEFEKAVEDELNEAMEGNSPEELVNLATEIKLTASTLLDLTKVISLCNKAEQLGLDEDNLEFARQLRISAQLDRGLAIAQLFMNPELDLSQMPHGWEPLRDNAIGDLTAAVKENPDIAAAQLGLGRLYMIADRIEEAKAAFDAAIEGVDLSGEVEVKTLAYMFRGDLESDAKDSIPYLQKAIELCPTDEPRLYSQLAEYYARVGSLDDSLATIEKGIEIAPENNEFKKQKARILVGLGRKDEARTIYEEASKDQSDNLLAQVDRGQFYALIGDHDAAIDVFTTLIDKYKGPALNLLRGSVYVEKREYDKALADANQALRHNANSLPALRFKGVVYLQMEKYNEAIQLFEQIRRQTKSNDEKIEATCQIAFARSKQGHYKAAVELLKKELEKDPKNTSVLRSLGDMELLYGHWAEAQRIYTELLEIDPDDAGVLNNYSWLLCTCPDEEFRDGALALEYGKKAAERTHYNRAYILSTLAAAYAENGDFESARKWSQKALDIADEFDENLESLKQELESYKEDKPWRETTDIMTEIEEGAEPAEPAEEAQPEPAEEEVEEAEPADEPEDAAPAEEPAV